MQCTAKEPFKRRTARLYFTTGVTHQYVSYDSAPDGLFENSNVWSKKSELAVPGRNEACQTALSKLGLSGKCFGDLYSASDRGLGERRSSNLLSVRIALHYLRGLPIVESLFNKSQISTGLPVKELISHACYITQGSRSNFRRCSGDLARGHRAPACTETDLHACLVKAAALEARVQAMGMARTLVPYQGPPVGYGREYGYAHMQAVRSYKPKKGSRKAAYDEPTGTAPAQAMVRVATISMSAYQLSLQAFSVTPTISNYPYAARQKLKSVFY